MSIETKIIKNEIDINSVNSVEILICQIKSGFVPSYIFFWSHTANPKDKVGKQCLSQWYPALFKIDGLEYYSAEHYMMVQKANLFGDKKLMDDILKTKDPRTAKELGRQVKGFDAKIWETRCFEIVVSGNIAKFEQNQKLKEYLIDTNKKILVEASPNDNIWGIGISEDHPDIKNPEKWKGRNLLGFALMKVRSILVN